MQRYEFSRENNAQNDIDLENIDLENIGLTIDLKDIDLLQDIERIDANFSLESCLNEKSPQQNSFSLSLKEQDPQKQSHVETEKPSTPVYYFEKFHETKTKNLYNYYVHTVNGKHCVFKLQADINPKDKRYIGPKGAIHQKLDLYKLVYRGIGPSFKSYLYEPQLSKEENFLRVKKFMEKSVCTLNAARIERSKTSKTSAYQSEEPPSNEHYCRQYFLKLFPVSEQKQHEQESSIRTNDLSFAPRNQQG